MECIPWHGRFNAAGYGTVGKQALAHRHILEQCFGPIPPKVVLHHTCGNRACINPAHLETMTQGEHTRLHDPTMAAARAASYARAGTATHCKHGQEWNETTTYRTKAGSRNCRTCHNEQARAGRRA